jgi:hypothetical protein
MDLNRIKPELIRKFSEHKNHLSKLDFWSFVDDVHFFSFKTSQVGFRYIQGNPNLDIIDQHVTSGRLAVYLGIEPIKLDDFTVEMIEIVQDIDVKVNEVIFVAGAYDLKDEFNTKNSMNTKDVGIFDIRCQNKKVTFRMATSGDEYIELSKNFH